MTGRIIFLIDLDSFYASAEEQRHPELKGKPIAICMFSGRTKDSGAIATSNYKARELGIHAGMYIQSARTISKKAKEAGKEEVVFVPADRTYYKEVSDRVMKVLRTVANSFQQVSIDEAYLDVSQKVHGDYVVAEKLALETKKRVNKETGLTCSVGIGPNKVVAKMAASAKKPDGLTVVRPEQVRDFLYPLPLKKLHGIGPKTVDSLKFLEIETIGDLAKADVEKIKPILGKNKAEKLWNRARGEDDDPVKEEEKKQFGRMGTLKKDTQDPDYIAKFVEPMLEDITTKLATEGSTFRTVSIMVITSTMNVKTRSTTLDKPTNSKDILRTRVMELVKNYMRNNPQAIIRRFGVGVSKLEKKRSGLSRFVN